MLTQYDNRSVLLRAQRRGLTLNPITTLYYIAPASFAFLSIPWFFIEARPLLADTRVPHLPHLLASQSRCAPPVLPRCCSDDYACLSTGSEFAARF